MTSEQKAYAAIRKGIAGGVYASGFHLRAADLAASFGISRTPVREALRRLHAEGLVEFHVNRGAFVADYTAKDADEIFDLRTILEGHAAGLATRHLTGEAIQQLVDLTDDMDRCASARARDLAGLTRANSAFHAAIIAAAANRRLAAMIAGVVEMSWVARTFEIYSDADLRASIFHHRELIRAFKLRDAAWSATIMSGHIKAAYHVFASAMPPR